MTVATSDNFNDVLEFVAPTGGVTVGVLVLISGVVVLPLATAAATVAFPGKCSGRVKNAVATTSQAWVAGQTLYWISGTATLTTSATGNTKIGYAAAIKASAAAVGDVILLQR
jgi:predicted RecA/RadA family phage recombinase